MYNVHSLPKPSCFRCEHWGPRTMIHGFFGGHHHLHLRRLSSLRNMDKKTLGPGKSGLPGPASKKKMWKKTFKKQIQIFQEISSTQKTTCQERLPLVRSQLCLPCNPHWHWKRPSCPLKGSSLRIRACCWRSWCWRCQGPRALGDNGECWARWKEIGPKTTKPLQNCTSHSLGDALAPGWSVKLLATHATWNIL